MKPVWLKVFCVLSLALLPGCGYTLNHRLLPVFTDPRGIFVTVFDNQTEETGAERVFTNALIREIESRGQIKTTSREAGGLELKGVITGISYPPTVFSNTGFKGLQGYRRVPLELGLTVYLRLTLVDPKDGRTLWTSSYSGFRRVEAPIQRTYSEEAPSTIGINTQSLIESKYVEVARDIMRDVYDDMVVLF